MRQGTYDPVAGNVGDLFPQGGTLRRRGPLPNDPVAPAPPVQGMPGLGTPDPSVIDPAQAPIGAQAPIPPQLPPGIDIGQIVGRPGQPGTMGLPGGQIPMGGAPSARDLIMAELGRRIRPTGPMGRR